MATETTSTSAYAWRPDVTAVAPIDAVPEALILNTSTVAGRVEGDAPAVRVAYVDDATAGFVAEGAAITEANPDLAEAVVHTGKVAQLVRLSREQYGQPNSAGLISESVRRAVTTAANIAYVRQVAPTSPAVTPPAGLINMTGIEDGGAVADDLDALIDLQATIAGNNGQATHIMLAPDAWASLRKMKLTSPGATSDFTSNASLLGAGTSDVPLSLLDLPVIVTPALASGTGLMVDQTAVVSAVGDVMVAVSDQMYFSSDSIGVRCTWRFGQTVVHADRIGKFTVTDPDA